MIHVSPMILRQIYPRMPSIFFDPLTSFFVACFMGNMPILSIPFTDVVGMIDHAFDINMFECAVGGFWMEIVLIFVFSKEIQMEFTMV